MLNDEDCKTLYLISLVYLKINNLYDSLTSLELDGQKDTEKYHKLIVSLKSYLAEEDDLFLHLHLTNEKIAIIKSEYFPQFKMSSLNDLESLINFRFVDSKPRRLWNKLLMYIEYRNDDTFEIDSLKYFLEKDDNYYPLMYKYKTVLDKLKEDQLILMNELIEVNKLPYEEFIIGKYYLSLINPDVESFYLSSNFSSQNYYLSSNIYAKLMLPSFEGYVAIKDFLLFKTCYSTLNSILNVKDEDYSLDSSKIMLSSEYFFRSGLLLMSDDYFDIFKATVESKVNESDHRISKAIIISLLNKRNNDQKIVQNVTLELKKKL